MFLKKTCSAWMSRSLSGTEHKFLALRPSDWHPWWDEFCCQHITLFTTWCMWTGWLQGSHTNFLIFWSHASQEDRNISSVTEHKLFFIFKFDGSLWYKLIGFMTRKWDVPELIRCAFYITLTLFSHSSLGFLYLMWNTTVELTSASSSLTQANF